MAEAENIPALAAELRTLLDINSGHYPGVTLRAGANAAELDACEASLRRPLPPQLRELLASIDGQIHADRMPDFPAAPWTRLLPIQDIVTFYDQLIDIVSMCENEFGCLAPDGDYRIAHDHRVGAAGAPVVAYNAAWIPFAVGYNGGGGPPLMFMIDMDPGEGAAPGRVIVFGCEEALSLCAPDMRALLADIVATLHRRHPEAAPLPPTRKDSERAGDSLELRHRKVVFDDGLGVWHQYL